MIVDTQRIGSGALAELISFHPEIACSWEWTLRAPIREKIGVAERSLKGEFSSLLQVDREYMQTVLSGHEK